MSTIRGIIILILNALPIHIVYGYIEVEASANACYDARTRYFSACSGSYDDIFYAPYDGTIEGVKLVHNSGGVQCSGYFTPSNWGLCWKIGVMVMSVIDKSSYLGNMLYPVNGKTEGVGGWQAFDSASANDKYWPEMPVSYTLSGYDEHSDYLLFIDPEYTVSTTDPFMLQYSEGYALSSTSDNRGAGYASVYFLYKENDLTVTPSEVIQTTEVTESPQNTDVMRTTEVTEQTTEEVTEQTTEVTEQTTEATHTSQVVQTTEATASTLKPPSTATTTSTLATAIDHRDILFESCIYKYDLFDDIVDLAIGYNVIHKKLQIKVSGPNTKWFAVGFGSQTMDGTYAITVSSNEFICEERMLGDHSGGIILATNDNIESVENVGERQVLITRDWFDHAQGSYDFTDFFECNVDSMDIVWSIGYDLNFGHHQKHGHASFGCSCNRIVDDISTSSTALEYETCIYRYDLFHGLSDFSIGYNSIHQKMRIKIETPNTRWFGLGFGGDTMSDTYGIIISSPEFVVNERILEHHHGGSILTTNSEIVKEEYLDEREMVMTRDWDDGAGYDFTAYFECNVSLMHIIWSVGYDLNYGHHQYTGSASFVCGCGGNLNVTSVTKGTLTNSAPSVFIYTYVLLYIFFAFI